MWYFSQTPGWSLWFTAANFLLLLEIYKYFQNNLLETKPEDAYLWCKKQPSAKDRDNLEQKNR